MVLASTPFRLLVDLLISTVSIRIGITSLSRIHISVEIRLLELYRVRELPDEGAGILRLLIPGDGTK